MVEGRLQRNPEWFGLRVYLAGLCDMVEGRLRLIAFQAQLESTCSRTPVLAQCRIGVGTPGC